MLDDLIRKNRSYRRFHQDVPIDLETLRNVVDLARLSATGSNLQPLKYVLSCDELTAAIPGLITVDQVNNAAAAVNERREFNETEATRYEQITEDMWANLPKDYGWLRNWECV